MWNAQPTHVFRYLSSHTWICLVIFHVLLLTSHCIHISFPFPPNFLLLLPIILDLFFSYMSLFYFLRVRFFISSTNIGFSLSFSFYNHLTYFALVLSFVSLIVCLLSILFTFCLSSKSSHRWCCLLGIWYLKSLLCAYLNPMDLAMTVWYIISGLPWLIRIFQLRIL